MDELLEHWRIPLIVILVLALLAGLVVLFIRWPRSTPPGARLAGPPSTPLISPAGVYPAISTPTPRQQTMKVYVTGAVARPGVYPFREGERVEDALQAAGGATEDADLTRLNMAQRLRDEGQIVVPRRGETPAAAAGAAPQAQTGKININSASVAELDALPGIGATYAQRIIDYRTANGPFQRISDLLDKKIVPQSTFDKIENLVEVR